MNKHVSVGINNVPLDEDNTLIDIPFLEFDYEHTEKLYPKDNERIDEYTSEYQYTKEELKAANSSGEREYCIQCKGKLKEWQYGCFHCPKCEP